MKHPAIRIPALDGLRGIAALSLMLYHFTSQFGQRFNSTLTTSTWEFEYGRYGLDLFFIISGFAIYKSIERLYSPAQFLYKRIIRLYPTFWFCMILTFVFIRYIGPAVYQRTLSELFINISMFPSLFHTRAIDDVYWSMLVQWCFYIFMLLLLFLALHHKMKYVTLIYLICYAFICFQFKFYTELYYGSLFLMGIAFYRIWRSDREWLWHLQIFCCLFLTLFAPNRLDFIMMSVLILIFYLFIYGETGLLKFRPLVFLGEISYVLYLIHHFIGQSLQLMLIERGLNNYFLLLLAPMLTMILLAYLITISFEKPVSTLLNRYGKKLFRWN